MTQADEDGPLKVMQAYIAATRDGDDAAMAALFHENAMLAGWLGETCRDGAPAPFIERVGRMPSGPDYAAEVRDLEVIGRSATATITETNLWDSEFVNRFHMLRRADGSWCITAKLFHCEKAKD